jgi:hypothetical protein
MEQQKEQQWTRWRGLLSEQGESGQSIARFCRDRELPLWQFYEWKKRLREPEVKPFVAVEVVTAQAQDSTSTAGVTSGAIEVIEVRLRGGRSLLVGPGFEADHLRRLLLIVEQPEA